MAMVTVQAQNSSVCASTQWACREKIWFLDNRVAFACEPEGEDNPRTIRVEAGRLEIKTSLGTEHWQIAHQYLSCLYDRSKYDSSTSLYWAIT